jgi:hypothetical protein
MWLVDAWSAPALPCRAVPCRAVPCRAVPCRAVPCRAVPCRAVCSGPYGATESVDTTGTAACAAGTWDAKASNLVALLGGMVDVIRQVCCVGGWGATRCLCAGPRACCASPLHGALWLNSLHCGGARRTMPVVVCRDALSTRTAGAVRRRRAHSVHDTCGGRVGACVSFPRGRGRALLPAHRVVPSRTAGLLVLHLVKTESPPPPPLPCSSCTRLCIDPPHFLYRKQIPPAVWMGPQPQPPPRGQGGKGAKSSVLVYWVLSCSVLLIRTPALQVTGGGQHVAQWYCESETMSSARSAVTIIHQGPVQKQSKATRLWLTRHFVLLSNGRLFQAPGRLELSPVEVPPARRAVASSAGDDDSDASPRADSPPTPTPALTAVLVGASGGMSFLCGGCSRVGQTVIVPDSDYDHAGASAPPFAVAVPRPPRPRALCPCSTLLPPPLSRSRRL